MSPTPKPASSLEIPPIASTGTRAEHREPHVVDHLARVLLEHRDPARARGRARERLRGERPQRDRAEQAHARALRAQLAHGVAREARQRAERHHDELGVVAVARLAALLLARDRVVLVREPLPELLGLDALHALAHADRVQVARAAAAAERPVHRPVLRGQRAEVERGDVDRLGRVREQEVAVDLHRVAPAIGEVERELGELDRLAHVDRREHDVAVVAVAAAARGLVVVELSARHVEQHERQLGARDLGQRLLHQRDPLAGRPGGRARAGGERAPRHADRLELALGVDAHAAALGQERREVLEQLGERRHRIAGEEAAARGERGARDRLGAFEQGSRHGVTSCVTGVSYW